MGALLAVFFQLLSSTAWASKIPEQMESVRSQMLHVQRELIEGMQDQQAIGKRKTQLQRWLRLQHKERALSMKRLKTLEGLVLDLESRRKDLRQRIQAESDRLRRHLVRRHLTQMDAPDPQLWSDAQWREEVVRRLSRHSVQELHIFRADLADAEEMEHRIASEKEQLQYVTQELAEQESLFQFHQELQADMIKAKMKKRAAQLEQYRQLKLSEFKLEGLIEQFHARVEFERMRESEKDVFKKQEQQWRSEFAQKKGHLSLPVAEGHILQGFGKTFDEVSQLTVFKKGVEFSAKPAQSVLAVAAGKVAYVGELPRLGQVLIVDHGSSFFTLFGQLGQISKKVGESVRNGDVVGSSDPTGKPVYFEIRTRNVALDPLQWFNLSFIVRK